jgi:D-ribulokinase
MESDMDSLLALYVAGMCGIAYGLRQIIEAQAAQGTDIERIMISGGAGRPDLVRQLLADATGKPVLANDAEEPVLLGAAILGSVAANAYGDVGAAMAGMSRSGRRFEPDESDVGVLHRARFDAFERLQQMAATLRQL